MSKASEILKKIEEATKEPIKEEAKTDDTNTEKSE